MRIPLYIDFKGKRVAVLGGGGVGTGRALKFIEAGAEVTVFSKDFTDELKKAANKGVVKLEKCDVKGMDLSILKEFDLVVVALADRSMNDNILRAARKYKTLVNLANDASRTEVVVPFEGGRDGIRFAVTTEGKSGIVARKVRDAFQKLLEEDEETMFLLSAMEHVKKYMKEKNVPVNTRMRLYYIVSSDNTFRKLVREEKIEEARKYAESLIEEYVSGRKSFDSSEDILEF